MQDTRVERVGLSFWAVMFLAIIVNDAYGCDVAQKGPVDHSFFFVTLLKHPEVSGRSLI